MAGEQAFWWLQPSRWRTVAPAQSSAPARCACRLTNTNHAQVDNHWPGAHRARLVHSRARGRQAAQLLTLPRSPHRGSDASG